MHAWKINLGKNSNFGFAYHLKKYRSSSYIKSFILTTVMFTCLQSDFCKFASHDKLCFTYSDTAVIGRFPTTTITNWEGWQDAEALQLRFGSNKCMSFLNDEVLELESRD